MRNNIKTKAAGVEGESGAYEEIYGLYFQLFADEQTRKNREDDNYLGLSHAYFLSDIRHVADQLKSGALSAEEEKRTWMEKETEVRDSVGLLDRLFFKANRESKDRLAEEYRSQAEKVRRECEWIAHEIETIQMQLTASGAKSDRIEERKRHIENFYHAGAVLGAETG